MKVLSIHYFQTPMFGVAPRAGHLRLFCDTGGDIDFNRYTQALEVSGRSQAPDAQRTSAAAVGLLRSVSRFLLDCGQPTVDTVIPLEVLPSGDGHIVSLVFSFWDKATHHQVLDYLVAELARDRGAHDAAVPVPERFRALAQQPAPPGLNAQGLIKNAALLRLSCMPLIPGEPILCLGTGKHSRLMLSTATDQTPALAMHMARDKHLMTRLLRSIGLPAPDSRRISDPEDALRFFRSASGPVVVKPCDKDCGQGVFARLLSEDQVSWAYRQARAVSRNLMIEEHIEGRTHRLTLADGKLIHARKRTPGGVTGDGISSLPELIAARMQEPEEARWRRRLGHERLELDEEATSLLEVQGLAPDSIPPAGQFVQLRRKDNINAGGSSDLLDLDAIHPDNVALARSAADAIGLDIAGVDMISTDIFQSWKQTGAAIIEVNAMPQFAALTNPEDHFRLFECLFSGRNAHVPYVLNVIPSNFRKEDLMALAGETGAARILTAGGISTATAIRPLPGTWTGLATLASDKEAERIEVAMTVKQLLRYGELLPFVNETRLVRPESLSEEERKQLASLQAMEKACEEKHWARAAETERWRPNAP